MNLIEALIEKNERRNNKLPRWKWIGNLLLLQKCECPIKNKQSFCHSGKCPGRIRSVSHIEGWCCFNVVTGENYKPHPENPNLNYYFVRDTDALKNTVRVIRMKKNGK